jgi:uncharacterized protein (TIGR02246 family)
MASDDETAIRALIANWHTATRAGDVDAVLALMAPDVVFLVPGQLPIRGRDAFGHGMRAMLANYTIESTFDIQEVDIVADMAYCWTHLTVKVLSNVGALPMHRSGNTLSILRKGDDGQWLLTRDANLLGAAS